MPGMTIQKRALRASCDNCHQAKVKCVPTDAGCQRCLSLNAQCIHSPPGRSGRAPASKESRRRSIPTPIDNTVAQSLDTSTIHVDRINYQTTAFNNGAEEENGPLSCSAAFDFSADNVLLDDVRGFRELADSSRPGWFSIPTSLSSSNPLHPLPLEQPSGIGEASAGASGFPISPTLSSALSDYVTGGPAFPALATPTPSRIEHQLFETESLTHRCPCFQSIVRALEKVQQANIRSLRLDVALSQNKETLIRICNSLKCTYPHDSTTRLLTLVLLRKNLHLYRLLYQSRLKSKQDSEPSEIDNTPTSHSSAMSYGFPVTSSLPNQHQQDDSMPLSMYQQCEEYQDTANPVARLTLGAYQLDAADEVSLKKQLFFLDVSKVPRLLERLDTRACGLDEGDGLDLYNMMRSSLIADFRAMMRDVQT